MWVHVIRRVKRWRAGRQWRRRQLAGAEVSACPHPLHHHLSLFPDTGKPEGRKGTENRARKRRALDRQRDRFGHRVLGWMETDDCAVLSWKFHKNRTHRNSTNLHKARTLTLLSLQHYAHLLRFSDEYTEQYTEFGSYVDFRCDTSALLESGLIWKFLRWNDANSTAVIETNQRRSIVKSFRQCLLITAEHGLN